MRFLTASVTVFALGFTSAAFRAPEQLPQKFTNLSVLPKDIAPRDLVDIMKQFCFDLGVRCEHCHQGEGNDLSKFDFASDARPAKATARVMLKMVAAINTEHLKSLARTPAPNVTCYTCHRGAARPATSPRGGGGSPGTE
jgi:hypothetical protein